MAWNKINYEGLSVKMLPPFLRKKVLGIFVWLFIAPIDWIYFKWSQYRIDNLYKLEHNGQVCSLRKSLNDKFDPVSRRIYIGNGQMFSTLFIYTEAEAQDVFLNVEIEDPVIYLRTESETADTGLDFIVYAPQEIINLQIHGLRSHINFYKAGGKRYNIYAI